MKTGINAKRRKDLESRDISCNLVRNNPKKDKSFLVGNIYRPPDSKVEWNVNFETFIECAMDTCKEIILLGDINKNLINDKVNIEWLNLITSLGLVN